MSVVLIRRNIYYGPEPRAPGAFFWISVYTEGFDDVASADQFQEMFRIKPNDQVQVSTLVRQSIRSRSLKIAKLSASEFSSGTAIGFQVWQRSRSNWVYLIAPWQKFFHAIIW